MPGCAGRSAFFQPVVDGTDKCGKDAGQKYGHQEGPYHRKKYGRNKYDQQNDHEFIHSVVAHDSLTPILEKHVIGSWRTSQLATLGLGLTFRRRGFTEKG
jgi:hypothetical protein